MGYLLIEMFQIWLIQKILFCMKKNNYSYQIASPEKALCDKLYTLKPIKNYDSLKKTLFSDLRIDEDEFKKLDSSKVNRLSNLYNSTNVKLLSKYMRRGNNE